MDELLLLLNSFYPSSDSKIVLVNSFTIGWLFNCVDKLSAGMRSSLVLLCALKYVGSTVYRLRSRVARAKFFSKYFWHYAFVFVGKFYIYFIYITYKVSVFSYNLCHDSHWIISAMVVWKWPILKNIKIMYSYNLVNTYIRIVWRVKPKSAWSQAE